MKPWNDEELSTIQAVLKRNPPETVLTFQARLKLLMPAWNRSADELADLLLREDKLGSSKLRADLVKRARTQALEQKPLQSLNIAQAAATLRISEDRVRELCASRRIDAFKDPHGRWRVPLTSIKDWQEFKRQIKRRPSLEERLLCWVEAQITDAVTSLKAIGEEVGGKDLNTESREKVGAAIWEQGSLEAINRATHCCANLVMLEAMAADFRLPVKRKFLEEAREWRWTINPL
jgi:hypothetical protein